MREAMYWKPLGNNRVRCLLCPLNCIIEDGKRGSCRVRKNICGRLYTLNYGKLSSMALDPIEKKPLFHFFPGSYAFSIGTVGCNMHCKHCQNWEISQADEKFPYLQDATPEGIVSLVKHHGCESIAYTYNEPTIWYEFVLDTAKLA
ncbi:MAG TPA: AmmeMemoRadiSam system radical SAM enzyme, partial [Thermococcus paralvinellae]|nr:AmmeMemoRadiSam system radical SAM enzyme [Thermococcus paralvinellae]